MMLKNDARRALDYMLKPEFTWNKNLFTSRHGDLFTVYLRPATPGIRGEVHYGARAVKLIDLPVRDANRLYSDFEEFWEARELTQLVYRLLEPLSESSMRRSELADEFKHEVLQKWDEAFLMRF